MALPPTEAPAAPGLCSLAPAGQRNDWCSTLQQKVTEQRLLSPRPPVSSSVKPLQRSGYLELKGYKSKVFAALILSELWLYKSEQVREPYLGGFLVYRFQNIQVWFCT